MLNEEKLETWDEIKEYLESRQEDEIDRLKVRKWIRELSPSERGKMIVDTKPDQEDLSQKQYERISKYDLEYMEKVRQAQIKRMFPNDKKED